MIKKLAGWIFILLSFISNVDTSEYLLPNTKIALVSQSKEDVGDSFNNLNDGNYYNYFNSGDFNPSTNPLTIYYDLETDFLIEMVNIYWNLRPKSFKLYGSRDCYYNYTSDSYNKQNMIWTSTINPLLCNNWMELYNYNDIDSSSQDIEQSLIPLCFSIGCSNPDNNIIKQFMIKIDELYQTQTHVMIKDINSYGINISTIAELIVPTLISFNETTDFGLAITKYANNNKLFFGNYNCSINYVNLTNIAGQSSNIVINDGEIYRPDSFLNISDNLTLCYYTDKNNNNSIGWKQDGHVTLNKLTGFEPQRIHRNSIVKADINSTYAGLGEHVALSNGNGCDNIHSENYLFSKIDQQFYDDSEDPGFYYLCYRYGESNWGQSDIKIEIIDPKILGISGCADNSMITSNNTYTSNCPTEGGVNMQLWGEDFQVDYLGTILEINNFIVKNLNIVNSSLINFNLPAGTGKNLEIRLITTVDVTHENMLSYHKPVITSVSSTYCYDNPGTTETLDCPNDDEFWINISGTNFGDREATILVGSDKCGEVTHYSHQLLSCLALGSRGIKQSVFVIQYGGEISEGEKLVSFKQCGQGFEFKDDSCHPCQPGYYKNTVADSYCISCPEGKISSTNGAHECKYCDLGFYPTNSSRTCTSCGHRYFKDKETTTTCEACLQNQITVNESSDSCDYCPAGYEVKENKCKKCPIGYYKKTRLDIDCIICQDGYYAQEQGMTECISCMENSRSNSLRDDCLCNEGYYLSYSQCNECDNQDFHGNILFNCDTQGLKLEDIENTLGYWRPDERSINFYQCKEDEHCPQNKIINGSVKCLKYHTGILCNLCIPGYAKDGDNICRECNSNKSVVQGMILSYFFIAVIGFIVIMTYVLLRGRALLHSFVNKLAARGFIDFKEMDEEISTNYSSDSDNSSISSVSTNSYNLEMNANHENNNNNNSNNNSEGDEEEHEINQVDSNIIGDNAIVNSIKKAGGGIQQKFKIIISYLQITTLLSSTLNIKWPKFIKDTVDAFNFINLDIFGVSQQELSCSFNTNYYHKFIMNLFFMPVIILLIKVSHILAIRFSDKKKITMKEILDRYYYASVLVVFILYPSIGTSILKIFKCDNIEDEWYLTDDLSIVCFDKDWTNHAILAAVAFLIYVIGIPYYFYHILKNNLNLIKNHERTLDSKTFSYRYGFIFKGYSNDFWWFEIVEMMKKITLLATVIYLDESATRVMIAMLMCFAYLIYITYYKPLISIKDNLLNILSGLEMFLLLLCALILEVKIDVQDAYNQFAFEGFMFLMLVGIICIGNYQILTALLGGNLKLSKLLTMVYSGYIKKVIEYLFSYCKTKKPRKDSESSTDSSSDDNFHLENDYNQYMSSDTESTLSRRSRRSINSSSSDEYIEMNLYKKNNKLGNLQETTI